MSPTKANQESVNHVQRAERCAAAYRLTAASLHRLAFEAHFPGAVRRLQCQAHRLRNEAVYHSRLAENERRVA